MTSLAMQSSQMMMTAVVKMVEKLCKYQLSLVAGYTYS